MTSFRQLQLEDTTTAASRTQELQKEVKEKNLLIGKLRHEGVFLFFSRVHHHGSLLDNSCYHKRTPNGSPPPTTSKFIRDQRRSTTSHERPSLLPCDAPRRSKKV